jgi:tight adherence protein B
VTRWRTAAAVGALAVLAGYPAAAAGGVKVDSVDTAEYPRVSVTVSLSAEVLGEPLTADDFAVVVGGVRPSVDVFALVADPIDVVVAIDTSGSMAGAAMSQARAAAVSFVEQMPDSVRVAVVAFATEPEVVAPFGTPTDEIISGLGSLQADGHTALYDAVVESSALFDGPDTRRVIVLLSDGGDTSSVATLDAAAAALEDGGIELRAVALLTSDTDMGALDRLSTGEPPISVTNASGLAAAYEALALELTGRYRLSFSTSSGGPTRLSVFVNTAGGIVTDSRVVQLPHSSVTATTAPAAGPGSLGDPASPGEAGAGIIDVQPPTYVVTGEPGALGRGWALPVGVALVFVGLAVAFWMTGRNDDQYEAPLPLDGLGLDTDEPEGRSILSRLGRRVTSVGVRVAGPRMARNGGLDQRLDRAGLVVRSGEYVVIAAAAVIVGVTAGLVFAGAIGAVLLGGAVALLPRFILRVLTNRRREAFADQLEGTLQIIAGSMRAGHALTQAISIVAAESDSPTSDEFNRVIVETRLGRPLEDSLDALADRMQNEDLGWVVDAIQIQHEVGGNLVEVLEAVMATIRDRNQLRRQVKALSAEGKMSAVVLLALPFVIAGFIGAMSPEYLAELTGSGVGRVLLVVAAVFMGIGALWIKKLIEVEY